MRKDGIPTHLLDNLRGDFEIIYVKDGDGKNGAEPCAPEGLALCVIGEDCLDQTGIFTQRLDATPGATYLVRPDQHLCARWRQFDSAAVTGAHRRALQR